MMEYWLYETYDSFGKIESERGVAWTLVKFLYRVTESGGFCWLLCFEEEMRAALRGRLFIWKKTGRRISALLKKDWRLFP